MFLKLHTLFPVALLIPFLFSGCGAVSDSDSSENLKERLEAHVVFLADDKLEGRESGTQGEKIAREYIQAEFKKTGLSSAGSDLWMQPFEFFAKKTPSAASSFKLGDKALDLTETCYPFALSGQGNAENCMVLELKHDPADPHISFNDLVDVREEVKNAIEAGYDGLVLWTEDILVESPNKNWRRTISESDIPVFWLTENPDAASIKISFNWEKDIRTGHNVVGKIDNGSEHTVIIGAHYDHLGWGEFGSLHNGEPEIHNGADDNASGVAGLIELARELVKNPKKGNNYVFIAFSGEELGLFGSKHYVRSNLFDTSGTINYMLNMDMIGRLDSVSHKLAVDGAKTSAEFSVLDNMSNSQLDVKPGGSGIGSSDHMSFYLEDVPSLHFFTGTHGDYHKPSDDEWLINYQGLSDVVSCMLALIDSLDDKGKISFNEVENSQEMVPDFKVTLGVIPDYMFEDKGMRIESVRDGRPAKLGGLQDGDVVIKMGDLEVLDMMSYMKALGAFNKGETVDVEVMRNGKSITTAITF